MQVWCFSLLSEGFDVMQGRSHCYGLWQEFVVFDWLNILPQTSCVPTVCGILMVNFHGTGCSGRSQAGCITASERLKHLVDRSRQLSFANVVIQ